MYEIAHEGVVRQRKGILLAESMTYVVVCSVMGAVMKAFYTFLQKRPDTNVLCIVRVTSGLGRGLAACQCLPQRQALHANARPNRPFGMKATRAEPHCAAQTAQKTILGQAMVEMEELRRAARKLRGMGNSLGDQLRARSKGVFSLGNTDHRVLSHTCRIDDTQPRPRPARRSYELESACGDRHTYINA